MQLLSHVVIDDANTGILLVHLRHLREMFLVMIVMAQRIFL